jgi:3-oxoacyl-[acyl-carrier protein] reductase
MTDGDRPLSDRIARVTGASGGIAAAIACSLAGTGAHVAVGYGANADRAQALVDVDSELFDRTLAINTRAPFLLAQAVLPGMRRRGFGRILFISSLAALRGGVLGPHYAASKAGLHGIAHFLASRVAPDGVTVNALAPGFVETEMLPGDPAELAAGIPVGRVGRPEEIAEMALAMLANGFLTSKVISIDGGGYPH